MTTRCFAFGCSLTNYNWATCADFIGVNFDEYYNLGRGGASNTFAMNRFIEAEGIFNFNETDTVIVGMTGFGRLSFFDDINNVWQTHGDILWGNRKHPEHVDIFNRRWALHSSYIAMKVIKEYLTSKGIIHYIYPAMDYKHWITDFKLLGLKKEDTLKVLEIENMLDIKEPLHEWIGEQRRQMKSHPIKFDDGNIEMHPSPEEHFLYFSKYFPQYNTDKSKELLDLITNNFGYDSMEKQSDNFRKISTYKIKYRSELFLEQ